MLSTAIRNRFARKPTLQTVRVSTPAKAPGPVTRIQSRPNTKTGTARKRSKSIRTGNAAFPKMRKLAKTEKNNAQIVPPTVPRKAMQKVSYSRAGTSPLCKEQSIVISGDTTPANIDWKAFQFIFSGVFSSRKKSPHVTENNKKVISYPLATPVFSSRKFLRRNSLRYSAPDTTIYNAHSIMPTLGYSRQASFSFNKSPMPPAPTKPSTAAFRTLDSKRYKRLEIYPGKTCRQTEDRKDFSLPPPVNSSARAVRRSAFSLSSYPNLVNTAPVETVMAATPGHTPNPNKKVQSSASISTGIQRTRCTAVLIPARSALLRFTYELHRTVPANPMNAPSPVPINEIKSVSRKDAKT